MPPASHPIQTRYGRLLDRRRVAPWVFGREFERHPAGLFVAVWLPLLLLAVGTLVANLRVPMWSWNLLWAEDGREFVADAYRLPLAEGLVHPWAGYLHVVPRVIAEIAVAVAPAETVAIWLTWGASLMWGASAAAVFLFAGGHIRSLAIRLGLWASIVLLPLGGLEVAGSIANSHWPLIFACFWAALVGTGASRGTVAAAIAVCLAATLSDPLALAVLPVIILRGILLRGVRAHAITVAYVVGIALQLVGVASTERASSSTAPSILDFADSFIVRVVAGGILGPGGTGAVAAAVGWEGVRLFGLSAFIAIVALALVAVRRTAVPVLAIGFAVGFSVVVTWLMWDKLSGVALDVRVEQAARYALVPSLALVSSVYVAVGSLVVDRARAVQRTAVAAMCLLPLIFVPSFQGPSGRAPFPDLAAQFDENGCDDGFVNVEAMPGGPVWRFAVPCAAFRGAADDVVDERPASGTPR